MESSEERNNEAKEERAFFGTSEAEEIKILGCWLGHKQDVKDRIKRAGMLRANCKGHLRRTGFPKESKHKLSKLAILFDCATHPWYACETKSLKSWIYKRYGHIWSNKNAPPPQCFKWRTRK